MPRKPKKPCRYPGCPNLSDHSYCELHRRAVKTEINRRYDKNDRDMEMRSFYTSSAWRKLRRLKLNQSPVCEECLSQKRLSPAVIVDHILPARDHPDKRLDISNLQSLCRACHNRKTVKEK